SKTGAIVWGDMTQRSARNQTGIAITIDNKVFSAPIASSRIEGGNTQVTGGAFNGAEGVFEADRVSSLLNNGKSGYRFIVIDVKDIKNDK
ncbi:MAG: SecDF P1 head subdomain-containing protein, partial [Flavobacteriales bacterium]